MIFFDEIDSTLSIPFSDDFFAALRAIYNIRPMAPDFFRLSFVLIGVATPNDLISDPKRTPFNIGRRVELSDFSLEEMTPFKDGFTEYGSELLQEIFIWTNGHPYLSQKVCKYLSKSVDKLGLGNIKDYVSNSIIRLFVSDEGQGDHNIQFVRSRLLERTANPKEVLQIYESILQGDTVDDDELSANKTHLKLSGVVRRRLNKTLRVSNKIYEVVFNKRWVMENITSIEKKESLRVRALEWIQSKDVNRLLNRRELTNAKQWFQSDVDDENFEEINEFILASEENIKWQKRLLTVFAVALFCLSFLGIWIRYDAEQKRILSLTEIPIEVNPSIATAVEETLRASGLILSTPVFTQTPSMTPPPTLTFTPVYTPTPEIPLVSVSVDTSCRSGPSKVYSYLGALLVGEEAEVVAKNSVANYWIIKNPDGGTDCWISGQYASVSGNTENLPEYTVQEMSTSVVPSAPSNFAVASKNCGATMDITISWTDNSSDEDGFKLYQNGNITHIIGYNRTSHALALSYLPNQSIQLALSAFNVTGESSKQVIDVICP